jgi:hypothetical protein
MCIELFFSTIKLLISIVLVQTIDYLLKSKFQLAHMQAYYINVQDCGSFEPKPSAFNVQAVPTTKASSGMNALLFFPSTCPTLDTIGA